MAEQVRGICAAMLIMCKAGANIRYNIAAKRQYFLFVHAFSVSPCQNDRLRWRLTVFLQFFLFGLFFV